MKNRTYNPINKDEIALGVDFIKVILSRVRDYTKNSEDSYYNYPTFIYRGISKFYPVAYDIKNSNFSELDSKVKEDIVCKDYISSGLSVRLRNTMNQDGLIRANYINVLQEMLLDARKHYPYQYPADMSDLDVLADIQHNGGATCLTDFSKNVLTSLWFACNTDFDDDGFLYCYNTMNDMIKNDALTIVRPEDENRTISSLLCQTYKETNICSDVEARFCIWEPSAKNNRILRQDSVFLFGIEKFHVVEHEIEVIMIPKERKKPILLALKALFNVSGTTIFNDKVGFATSNGKNISQKKICDSPYNRGYTNMLRGNYNEALEFFRLSEDDPSMRNNSKYGSLCDESHNIELHFSLAVCYKNLSKNREDIGYMANAIEEYEDVVQRISKLFSHNLNDTEKNYYRKKYMRALCGIFDMNFYTQRYLKAIESCKRIIKNIEKMNEYSLSTTENNEKSLSGKKLNSKYCKIELLELYNLELLNKYEYYKENRFPLPVIDFKNNADVVSDLSHFDKSLIKYYESIFQLLTCSVDEDYKTIYLDFKKYIISLKKCILDSDDRDKYNGYILWNFIDIKTKIDSINTSDDVELENKKIYLQQMTALIISFRDFYEMQSFGGNQDF